MIPAGTLIHVVELQRETETVSASGAPSSAWTNFASVRAEIKHQTADEYLTGFGEAERSTLIMRIRYRSDITTADRAVYKGQAYNLKEVVEIGRKHGLELRVSR